MAAAHWLRVVVATFAAAAFTCLDSGTSATAIAGGIPATAGADAFAVRLTMAQIPRPDGTFYRSACSGALISPTWLITAGHCFHDVNRNPVSGLVPYATKATLYTTDLATSPGESRWIIRVRQSRTADIALAELNVPVTDVAPLAISQVRPTVGTVVTLAGWGATSDINPVPSTRLRTGQMKITRVRADSIDVIGYAPSADTSACLYDSGAPYFTTRPSAVPLLVSVESNGPACPHASPESTARTDTIASWIAAVVPDIPRPYHQARVPSGPVYAR
jgi:V8-like Glu-specific endopeptidase